MKKPRLNILGASGHGKVVADIAKLNGYDEIYFYDDNRAISFCGVYPVVGVEEDLKTADHDCIVGDYCHIAVGAHLCGTVRVGNGSWIGAGATVSNNVNICSYATVGAGAVVIHDIEESGTYIGVPVKKMETIYKALKIREGGRYCSYLKYMTGSPSVTAFGWQRRRAG